MNNETEMKEALTLPAICQTGDSTDFPHGSPTLCVTLNGDITGSYTLENNVSIREYPFQISEISNTVSDGIRTISLQIRRDSATNYSQSLRTSCSNEGETQVEVYLLNEAGRKPRRPVIHINEDIRLPQ